MKTFLRPSPASRKSPLQFILSFFPVHTLSTEFRRLSARHGGYPPLYAQLLHRSLDVTPRIPAMIVHRNHSVFSRRPSVNPNSLPPPLSRPPKRPSNPATASHVNPIHNSPVAVHAQPRPHLGRSRLRQATLCVTPGTPALPADCCDRRSCSAAVAAQLLKAWMPCSRRSSSRANSMNAASTSFASVRTVPE